MFPNPYPIAAQTAERLADGYGCDGLLSDTERR
jgi:hypothetical protein